MGGPGTRPAPTVAPTPRPRPPEAQAYLEPKRFRERNLQLIRAIKDFLQSDETRFSQFKSHSGEFRQVSSGRVWWARGCKA